MRFYEFMDTKGWFGSGGDDNFSPSSLMGTLYYALEWFISSIEIMTDRGFDVTEIWKARNEALDAMSVLFRLLDATDTRYVRHMGYERYEKTVDSLLPLLYKMFSDNPREDLGLKEVREILGKSFVSLMTYTTLVQALDHKGKVVPELGEEAHKYLDKMSNNFESGRRYVAQIRP